MKSSEPLTRNLFLGRFNGDGTLIVKKQYLNNYTHLKNVFDNNQVMAIFLVRTHTINTNYGYFLVT
jgi:hypothetical protein